MLTLPEQFIVFDMEWTAWEGSRERGWSDPGEYREVYDIGAVAVDGKSLEDIGTFHYYVKLEVVPELPEYSVSLTGITQATLNAEAIPFSEVVPKFSAFCGSHPVYCWGRDGDVLAENCELKKIANPFPPEQFRDVREVFREHGVPVEEYQSSTIPQYFGKENPRRIHQGINDALSIVEGLRALKDSM